MTPSLNSIDSITHNLDQLHCPGFLVARVTKDLSGVDHVEADVYKSKIAGIFVFLWGKLNELLGSSTKVYANVEGKRYIIFNAKEYFATIAKKIQENRNPLPLSSQNEIQIPTGAQPGTLQGRVAALARDVAWNIEDKKIQEQLSVLLIPLDDESPEEWSQHILKEFNIESGRDASSLMITIKDFPPEKIDHYLALQNAIAKRIPLEASRPTIDLRIRGSGSHLNKRPTLGIMGGMGPISDAEILSRAISIMTPDEKKELKIDLFSSPPPRTPGQKIKRGMKFLADVKAFASRPEINKIYLTSNTAHADFAAWDKRLDHKLHSLVDDVVNELRSPTYRDVQTILILGTKEAYDKKLYPKKLDAGGFTYAEVSEEESVELQKMVDLAKAGKPEEVADLLVALIQKKKNENPDATHALLGCTELPMIMNVMKKDRRVALPLKFIDSETIFIDIIRQAALSKTI